jgi:glycosyltransferase involved in cell wall biosynthesis
MGRLVAEAASRRPRVVVAHLFRMAPYALEVPGAYRILDLCDAVGGELLRSLPHRRGLSRLVYTIETPRVRRYEVRIAERFDEVWAVSPRDREELVERGAPPSMRVIPNGVDPLEIHSAPRPVPSRPPRVLFVGHLAVPHNADAVRFFASQVMPIVRREEPAAEFVAVGEGAGAALVALERSGLVRLTGFVPDLAAMLRDADVFVAPLRFAAGVQNKVLEAMAAGLPVVATPAANAGIGAQPGQEIVLAAEPGSFAAETLALMRDPQRSARLGSAGRELVASRFTWDALRARTESLRMGRAKAESH